MNNALTYEKWKKLRDLNSDRGEPIQHSCRCAYCYANYQRGVDGSIPVTSTKGERVGS
ncbi:MAG: hypothetical protein K0Q60_3491 [Microvirga sp.]|nr:hypothetical protein [Microvirga sp.]